MHKNSAVVYMRTPGWNMFFSRIPVFAVALGIIALFLAACTTPPSAIDPSASVAPDEQKLNPGDVILIAFPTTPNLNTQQQIRRDGRVNLHMIGEVKVIDKTPAELEQELLKAYADQLRSNEIKVTVVSSAFAVYVQGAVMKPGKIFPERSITAFDAIMEAGGFDLQRANQKQVRVIRRENGEMKNYVLDMKAVLQGRQNQPFYLKSYDTVYVPEKFSWF